MHERLIEALDRADLAVAAGSEVLEPGRLDAIAETIRAARIRLGRPPDVLVVALAGGTGSGKSSIFNVLTGSDAAITGGVRPTTAAPLAAVPSGTDDATRGVLAELGLEQRIVVAGLSQCLIDLPDTDSIEAGHRLAVEAVLPVVDLIVWVVDPVKYRDAAFHHRYLRPSAAYSAQFLVALNQVDRLEPEDVEVVLTDLQAALDEDGLHSVPVVAMAAAPPAGPPRGVDELREALASLATGPLLYSKLLADLRRAGDEMSAAIGPPSEYRERAPAAHLEVARRIAAGDRRGAAEELGAFYERLGLEVGGLVGDRIGEFAATAPSIIDRISSTDSADGRRVRWWQPRKPIRSPSVEELASLLDEQARGVGEDLARRAGAAAAAADLGVAVRAVSAGLPG